VIRAQVTEAKTTTELSGVDDGSWSGVRRLCRAVVVWHGHRDGSR